MLFSDVWLLYFTYLIFTVSISRTYGFDMETVRSPIGNRTVLTWRT